jgi:hypothetical protein
MNPLIEETIAELKKRGEHKMAILFGLAYSLGVVDGQAQALPKETVNTFEKERATQ